MKYLKIQNTGLLDIRLISLMGGTTKSNDQYKIGQWGSGLKYTLAWLLKHNLDFHIYIGGNKVNITTEVEDIRGERFEIICIDGKRTSVTTMMGGEANRHRRRRVRLDRIECSIRQTGRSGSDNLFTGRTNDSGRAPMVHRGYGQQKSRKGIDMNFTG